MYYIGLDVHKKTISYCVKDASGQVHQEGQIGATRWELDGWMKTLPQPWTVAMEATIFTGWIYPCLISFKSHPLGGAIPMPLVWCSSSDPLERPREVALICKTCCHSHHGKA